MRRVVLGLFSLFFLISVSGCQTVKGMSEGIAVDARNTWKAIARADEWFKENCW